MYIDFNAIRKKVFSDYPHGTEFLCFFYDYEKMRAMSTPNHPYQQPVIITLEEEETHGFDGKPYRYSRCILTQNIDQKRVLFQVITEPVKLSIFNIHKYVPISAIPEEDQFEATLRGDWGFVSEQVLQEYIRFRQQRWNNIMKCKKMFLS